MNTLATAKRLLTQLRHDPGTVMMLILVPGGLLVLLRWVFDSEQVFGRMAPALLGVFPFMIMFLIASITTLRERTTATLERLMTMPVGKMDLLFGYALAFGVLAFLQVVVTAGICLLWLGVEISGPVWALILVALLNALLGMAMGLFVSAFARSEFQAMQFLPVFAMPQALLCGLFVPREEMTPVLETLSDVMPLSYAVDAMNHLMRFAELNNDVLWDFVIVGGCTVLALLLGSVTLRRRTP